MIKVGVERLAVQGRVWLEGYVKFKARGSDETDLTPKTGFCHLYAKTVSGVTRLYYRDDANVEHGPL